MKKIVFLRHSEALTHLGHSDFDRPLTEKGHQMAKKSGSFIKEHCADYIDIALVSTSVRTMQTAQIVLHAVGQKVKELVFQQEMYNASLKTLTRIIEELPEHINFVLLVGHNPAISDLASVCTGHHLHLNPADLVIVEFQINQWAEIAFQRGEVLHSFTAEMSIL